jgi:hypothetical protein
MLYFTPRSELKRLTRYNSEMSLLFARVQTFREYNRGESSKNVYADKQIEVYRAKLNYDRSWVDEIARRYGKVLPWKVPLERLQYLSQYLYEPDPLDRRGYQATMNILMGAVQHQIEKDRRVLLNPFNLPGIVFLWFAAPLVRSFAPTLSTGAAKAFEEISKNIGRLVFFVVLILIAAWLIHSNPLTMLKNYIAHATGQPRP